jgi:hypothetical protein
MRQKILIIIFLIIGHNLIAQKVLDEGQFGRFIVKSFSNRVVKLYQDNILLLTVPFNENVNNFPDVFMEDVDFDGDLDLFISDSCGSNCDYNVYTNYKGKFALNSDVTQIAFLSDYFFDKTNKYFYFFEHVSAAEHKIKFYKWIGPKLLFYKEVYEDGSKGDGYYDVTSKELEDGKWVIKTYRTIIPKQ